MLGGGERAWRRQLIALAATGVMVLFLGIATLSSAGRRPFSLVGKQSSISDHRDHSVAGKWDRASKALAKNLVVSGAKEEKNHYERKTFQAHDPFQAHDTQEGLEAMPAQSNKDVRNILLSLKAQQAEAEAQMKKLMQLNSIKASALSRALDGDSFNKKHVVKPHLTKRHIVKSHPRNGRPLAVVLQANSPAAKALATQAQAHSSKHVVSVAANTGIKAAGVARTAVAGEFKAGNGVQGRVAQLLTDSRLRLAKDEQRIIKDLTSEVDINAPWFQQQHALLLKRDRDRVIGDQRLIKMLANMKRAVDIVPMQHLDAIDIEARDDLAKAEMRTRGQSIADEVNPNTFRIKAAGVYAGSSRDLGLGGMDADIDVGERALNAAGVRTDALPGFGTNYREAIPLPFYDLPENEQHNIKELEEHHRAISPAGAKLLNAKVTLASPNIFIYGSESQSTPHADRPNNAQYVYADGLEDAETSSRVARRHTPLTFWLSNPKEKSERLTNHSVNVFDDHNWEAVMVRPHLSLADGEEV
jgi:hypothetical protein